MSIKGMALPKGGNKLPLLLGLCFGLMAAIGVIVLLSGSSDKSSSKPTGPAVDVVVAGQDIAAGTAVTADMLQVKPVAETDKLLEVFTTKDAVVGQVTTVPIIKGEQVVASKVTSDKVAREKF